MARSPARAALADAPKAPPRRLGDLRLIFDTMRRYPGRLAMAALALLISSLATTAIPIQLKPVVDHGFHAGTAERIAPYFYALFGIVLVLAIATATRFYFVSWLGERVVADIRNRVQAHLLNLSPGFFEENRPSEIASRMTSDTAVIDVVVGSTFSIALRNLITGTALVVYILFLAPTLALALLLGIPVVVLPIIFLGRRVTAIARKSQDRVADVGAVTSETLGAMKIVQGFGQEAREAERFRSATDATFATAKQRIRLRAMMTASVIFLLFGSITWVMWQGAVDVVEGRMTGGALASFIFAGALVAGSFGALTETWGDLLRAAGAAGRLAELLRERPTIAAPERPVLLPSPPRGQLTFDNVTFRYPTRPDVAALHGFSMRVLPGETVALVGPSGAGKSTIFQLALRFYDPQGGTIRLDGVTLPSADPRDVRRRMAYVPQETVLFAASARDNLRYGQWDATDDQLMAAARLANAADFLNALPDGLDTFLGEGGARLSGGQRQRIAIARALLRDAPILLLDEATSALDAESERLVQDALDRLMTGRTTLVIAHRLATVRAADRIIVMDQGRIVEEGTHATLSAHDGLYARLARLQFDTGPAGA